MVSTSSPPALIDFLDYNCRYKSVPTQISHNAGLEPIPHKGRESLHTGDRTSVASSNTCSKQNALNIDAISLGYGN
jgi:hypothetical protein